MKEQPVQFNVQFNVSLRRSRGRPASRKLTSAPAGPPQSGRRRRGINLLRLFLTHENGAVSGGVRGGFGGEEGEGV